WTENWTTASKWLATKPDKPALETKLWKQIAFSEFVDLSEFQNKTIRNTEIRKETKLKTENETEYRVISHQSAPKGASVNDGISKKEFEIKYENVAHAAKWIRFYGQNCQLVKVDIKEAYRNLPIHPLDQTLQGVVCEGKLYFDQ